MKPGFTKETQKRWRSDANDCWLGRLTLRFALFSNIHVFARLLSLKKPHLATATGVGVTAGVAGAAGVGVGVPDPDLDFATS